jgi:hypothetical protein
MRIFKFILPGRVSWILAADFIITFVSYLAATIAIFRGDADHYLWANLGLRRCLLVSLSCILGIFFNDLYAETRVDSRVSLVLKLCNVAGIALVTQGLLAYLLSGLALPRMVMLPGSLLAFAGLLAWRLLCSRVVLKAIGSRRILFVGTSHLIQEIAGRISRRPELGIEIAGYLDGGADGSFPQLGTCLGPAEDLPAIASQIHPDWIVFADCEERVLPAEALLSLVRCGVSIECAATAFETICGRVSSRDLNASQIVFHDELASRPGSVALQSVYANLVGLCAMIVTAPVLILISIAIKLTSRGPILDPDVRAGQHGIPFNLNRFRCHRISGSGPGASLEERLTPVGKWLQRFNLVNLPQVLNLLRGEITLVGPQPERLEFVEELTRYLVYYRQRFAVKPGITGWSQINTDASSGIADSLTQLEYDLYYTKHISLALDAYILLHGLKRLLPFGRA